MLLFWLLAFVLIVVVMAFVLVVIVVLNAFALVFYCVFLSQLFAVIIKLSTPPPASFCSVARLHVG